MIKKEAWDDLTCVHRHKQNKKENEKRHREEKVKKTELRRKLKSK